MKMGVCAHLDGQKRFLCEIRGFKDDFGDFFSNIGAVFLRFEKHEIRRRKYRVL